MARIEFPSAISHLEPLIPSGVNVAVPFRYAGDLWLLADGRVRRGIYDQDGRLEHFSVPCNPRTPEQGLGMVRPETGGHSKCCTVGGWYFRLSMTL